MDDEYIIIIESVTSNRGPQMAHDSKITMGAYQAYHLPASHTSRGGRHMLRMALRYEHLGMVDDMFQRRVSSACTR
jgi:phospholipase D1/2